MHRSLRELDQELVKHNLVFGRGKEKESISGLMIKDDQTTLITGLAGMGKTSLMLDLLRDVGGVDSSTTVNAGPDLVESGHSFYFEDLETFIRFLSVRSRPITFRRAGISVKWDDNARSRKEVVFEVGKESTNDSYRDGKASASGTSPAFQTEMLQVMTHMEVTIETKFEEEEILKKINAHLTLFSNELAERIGLVRRGQSCPDLEDRYIDDAGPSMIEEEERSRAGLDFALPLIFSISDAMDGKMDRSGPDHDMAISCIEEHMESLVELLNKEIYMSLSSFLTRGRENKGKVQFEESLQMFLDNAHMDKLVPGRATFWRWYFGLDHIEREVKGWTLDRKKGAIKLIFEKFSEKEGFHLVAAMDNNPRLIFPSAGNDPGMAGPAEVDGSKGIRTYPVEFPERRAFIDELARYIDGHVAVQGMTGAEIKQVLERLYDRCHGNMRFYYLIRNIKNLRVLFDQGVSTVQPDTAFIDKQVHEVLSQLGVRYESEMSIENIWALRPLIALAEFEKCGTTIDPNPGISKAGFTWFLNAYGAEKKLELNKYLEIMDLYGLLTEHADKVAFFSNEVRREFQTVAERRMTERYPLLTPFLSKDRLERFMRSMSLTDILQLSDYLSFIIRSNVEVLKAEADPFDFIMTELNEKNSILERNEKNALLISVFIRSGMLPRIGNDEMFTSCARTLIKIMGESKNPRLLNEVSIGLERLTRVREDERRCGRCGAHLGDAQVLCPICQTDYRIACGSCGRRTLPSFLFCPYCGSGSPGSGKICPDQRPGDP